MRAVPTISQRLFRIHITVTLVAVVLLSIGTTAADWHATRQLLINDFENSLNAAIGGGATYLHLRDMKNLEIHLSDFHRLPGINSLCVYDAQNKLVSAWKSPEGISGCPSFIMHEGTDVQWLSIASAKKLMVGTTYVGMLYADTRLIIWQQVLIRSGLIFMVVVSVASLATYLSSRLGARAITVSLKALQEQIECLTNNDFTVCAVPPPMTTQETAGLAKSITAFRTHLAIDTLPRAELKQTRNWYCQILSGLLVTLRQQLGAEAPLLDTVAHYELLLQMEWGNALPNPVVFDIAKLLKASVSSARSDMRDNDQLHVNVTLQSSIQHEWLGHPEILRTLLKHLLLIAMRRTRIGAVCLRLEVDEQPGFAQQHMLRLKLEDSGPPLQRWQLRQWLDQVKEDVPTIDLGQDISWVLTGRLFHYLGGGATAQTEPSGGLTLMGWVPLLKPEEKRALGQSVPRAQPASAPSVQRPLVMAVEEQSEKRRVTRALLEQAGCRVFMLENHAQAIEWAPALPFSAILLNGFLADARGIVARRLRNLMEEKLMPEIPLWAMTTKTSPNEQQQWQQVGVVELIGMPASLAALRVLCDQLKIAEQEFYHAYDEHLHGDFPSSVIIRLSELNKEMASQVARAVAILSAMGRGETPVAAAEQIHAVKSAALTLGYYRLSALMSEIEHALSMDAFRTEPKHWTIIAESLQASTFEQL